MIDSNNLLNSANKLEYLIVKEVNHNTSRSDGMTLAHEAAFGGHVDVLEYLLDRDITLLNVTTTDNGSTLAHYAAMEGHVEVLI